MRGGTVWSFGLDLKWPNVGSEGDTVNRRLEGRVALITGAASGIGASIARRFVAEGASVVGLDMSSELLVALHKDLGDAFGFVVGDVRAIEAHRRAVDLACSLHGGLDTLVPNAGVSDAMLPLSQLSDKALSEAFAEIFSTNVLGYLLAVHASIGQLRARRGSIVFTVSNTGFQAGSGGGILYTASKHAVVGVVRQLAYELAPYVRVNGVAPGGTITGLRVAGALHRLVPSPKHFFDPSAASSAIRRTNALGIAPGPADHAGLYVLLASGDSPAVTGQIISSDGGIAVRGLGR